MTAFVSKVSDSSVSRYTSPIETFVTRIELIVHFKLGKFTTKCCVINCPQKYNEMQIMVLFLKEKSEIAG